MITLKNVVDLVFKTMFEKKTRVLLTISGIIIGIFTFTFFILASQGLENAITAQFTSFGVDVLVIQPAGQTGSPAGSYGLTDTDIEEIKQVVRDYQYIAPAIFYSTLFEFDRQKTSTITLSYRDDVLDELYEDIGFEIIEGRTVQPQDRGVATIGYKFATEAFEDKEINVGDTLYVGKKKLRVIGILRPRGDLFVDNSVFTTFDDIQEISGEDTYSVIRIRFNDNADLDFYREQIDRKLNRNGQEKRIDITSPNDAVDTFNSILGVLTAIIAFISSVALVVGGINVLNTMYSNVLERKNEISVLKALGAENKDILLLFLSESFLLGLIGALFGFAGSYTLAEMLSYIITEYAGYNVPLFWSWQFFLGVTLVTACFSMLFGTYPALQAAYIPPADNLRDE